jgi:hypothetical protein
MMLHTVLVPHCASRTLHMLVTGNINSGVHGFCRKNAYLEKTFLTHFFSNGCHGCIMSTKSGAHSIE